LEKKSVTKGAAKQISGYVARFRERQAEQKKTAVQLGEDDDEPQV
jgi:hypothetical protein